MKRQVQQIGVRKWFGDDWVTMQDELFSVLEGFFGSYGQQFVLSGCEVAGNDISAGIVGLVDGTGFHLCRFDGVQGTAWPVYFYPTKVVENRAYLDNQAKPVAETWAVATSGNNPGGYFQLKQDGTSARFFDAIQTATRRFVTDAEKTSYAGQAASAINTIRSGVAADYDTLAKVAAILLLKANTNSPALTGTPTAPTAATATNNTQIATTAFVKAVVAALVDSSPAALDTLNELATALGNDPNFATTMTNALAAKEPANANIQQHIASQANPHAVTKAQVGLSNVDNTSDANKPVSTAQQTALNLKANLNSPAFTGTPSAPTAANGTNNTQIATTAFVQAVVSAIFNNAALTGVPTAPTAATATNNTQIATTAFVKAVVAALVDSSPAALDTLNELATALGNDPNFATTMTNALAGKEPAFAKNTAFNKAFGSAAGTVCQGNDARLSDQRIPTDNSVTYGKVSSNLKSKGAVTNAVNLSAAGIGTITLTANTAFSFSGFELNKTYLLIITTNGFTPSWAAAAKHVPVDGNADFDNTSVFYVSLTCIDATAGNEKLLTMIMKGA